MSQNDFSLANQGFPQFRSDLNSALQALASASSGSTAPGTTYAYQLWYDTSTDLLKMRNADNDSWITLAAFDQTADEWELRTAVVQAVDSAGVVIKTADGTPRVTVDDSGDVTLANALVVTGTAQSAGITDGTTTVGTNYIVNGSAKAWVNFDGTGTVAIRDSFNVASLTDNGTGDYTVNINNDFAAADYAASFGAGYISVVNSATQSLKLRAGAGSLLAGSVRVVSVQTTQDTSVVADFEAAMINCTGDLA